ncbi:hypothetical protein EDD11_003442 [Mortierella claussenii]|nr:hypothetical protein EDD11_003442 [Mortierella claussenii]
MNMADDTGQPSIRRDFELYGPPSASLSSQQRRSQDSGRELFGSTGTNQGSAHRQSAAAHPHTTDAAESAVSAAAAPSTSPSPLPSPAPSVTSPDWGFGSSKRQHHPYAAPQYKQWQQQHHSMDLLSPSNSEADLGADSKIIVSPLFPSSPSPLFTSNASHLSPRPATTGSGPAYMTASHSGSSSHPLLARSFDPVIDSKAMSSPMASSWPSKSSTAFHSHPHHHKLPPIRAPERAGQDVVMKTSSLNTESSEYLNMDFYSIYRENPRLLRPEGGRNEERKHSHTVEDKVSGAGEDIVMMHGHVKRRGSGAMEGTSSSSLGLSRRQSMPLMLTATGRVLRHENVKAERSEPLHAEVVRGLGIQDVSNNSNNSRARVFSADSRRPISEAVATAAGASATSATLSTRPAAMSIRHLLTEDAPAMVTGSGLDQFYDNWSSSSSDNNSCGYSGGDGARRKKSRSVALSEPERSTEENAGESKKRTRMSKKRAAELGLLDADGNIISSRKRNKKSHDPDHVSPSGFTHGGERVVQEPEEIVILEPDVGPISMLDIKPPPVIHWKGQPLPITDQPGVEYLHPHEIRLASTLRLSPAQYLSCKKTIIMASREFYAVPNGKQFRKSDAQKICRIDVNKTSRLWEFFAKIGWLAGISGKNI